MDDDCEDSLVHLRASPVLRLDSPVEYKLQLVSLNVPDFPNTLPRAGDNGADDKDPVTVGISLRASVDRTGEKAKERQAQSAKVAVIGF